MKYLFYFLWLNLLGAGIVILAGGGNPILGILTILFAIGILPQFYGKIRDKIGLSNKNFKIGTWIIGTIIVLGGFGTLPPVPVDTTVNTANENEKADIVKEEPAEAPKEEKVVEVKPVLQYDLTQIEGKNYNEMKTLLGEPLAFIEPTIGDEYTADWTLSGGYYLQLVFNNFNDPIDNIFVSNDSIDIPKQQYLDELGIDKMGFEHYPVKMLADESKITGILIGKGADDKLMIEEYESTDVVFKSKRQAFNNKNFTLISLVENSMNDPKSFEHVSTTHYVEGGMIRVNMSFRGKNAFGGLVLDDISAYFLPNGTFVSIIEE